MSRVLLTGASGFLGAGLLAGLLAKGHTVAALLRDPAAPRLRPWGGRFTAIHGSLDRPGDWAVGLRGFGPDTVIHAAWSGLHGAERQDEAAQQRNVAQALALQDLTAKAGARHFIGLGSQAEFGPLQAAADESTPRRPDSAYGRAKVQAWEGLKREGERSGMLCAWVRVFSLYGPGDDPRWVLPATARALLAGQRPQLGLCTQGWDFLYVSDAVDALLGLMDAKAGGDFNLGSGEAPSLRSTLERLRDLIDPALPLGFGERPEAAGQGSHLQAVPARLRAVTAWAPTVTLDDGLRRLVASLR